MPTNSLFPRRYPRRRAESVWRDLYQRFAYANSFEQCQKIACCHLGIDISESLLPRTITSDFISHHDILRIYGADSFLQALISDQPLSRPLYLDRQKCLMGWRFEQKLFQFLKAWAFPIAPLPLSEKSNSLIQHFHQSLKNGKAHIAYANFHQALAGKQIETPREQAYILSQFAPYFTPTLFNYVSQNQADATDPAIAPHDYVT